MPCSSDVMYCSLNGISDVIHAAFLLKVSVCSHSSLLSICINHFYYISGMCVFKTADGSTPFTSSSIGCQSFAVSAMLLHRSWSVYVTESDFDSLCRAWYESTSWYVHLLTYSWNCFLLTVLVCDKIDSIDIHSHQFVLESSRTYALRLEFVYLPIVYTLLPILSPRALDTQVRVLLLWPSSTAPRAC